MAKETFLRLIGVMLAVGALGVRGEVAAFGHGETNQAGSDPARQGEDVASECSNCMFGVDGRNDMGNGLKAIYRMDWEYDGQKRESRDRWLGVSGDFGELKLGTLSTASKSAGVIPDTAYRPSALNPSGLPSVPAGYKVDANGKVATDDAMGLSYENAGLLIFADYISGNAGNDEPTYNVGARLATDNFGVFGQYRIDTNPAENQLAGVPADATNIWFLGGSLTVGATSIYAGYGRGDDGINAGAAPGYDAWEVVGVRSVGKLTSIFAGYSGTGCAGRNSDTCNKPGADVSEDDKFSLGIRHNF